MEALRKTRRGFCSGGGRETAHGGFALIPLADRAELNPSNSHNISVRFSPWILD